MATYKERKETKTAYDKTIGYLNRANGVSFADDTNTKNSWNDYISTRKDNKAVQDARGQLSSVEKQKPNSFKYTDKTYNKTLNNVLNNEDFNFDISKDKTYQTIKNDYSALAQKGISDTNDYADSINGGYANDFSQSAAQQAYDAELQHIQGLIPQLYAQAMETYGINLQNDNYKFGVASDKKGNAYAEYRNAVTDWKADREYEMQRLEAEQAEKRKRDEFAFGVYNTMSNRNNDINNLEFSKYMEAANLEADKYSREQGIDMDLYSTDKALEDAKASAAKSKSRSGGTSKTKDNTPTPKPGGITDMDSFMNALDNASAEGGKDQWYNALKYYSKDYESLSNQIYNAYRNGTITLGQAKYYIQLAMKDSQPKKETKSSSSKGVKHTDKADADRRESYANRKK